MPQKVQIVINGVNKAGSALKEVSRQLGEAEGAAGKLDAVLRGMGKIAVTGMLTTLGSGLAALVKGTKVAAELETVTTQFEVLTGSAKVAKDTIEGLRDFAKTTPLSFDAITEGAKNLMAFGVSAQDVQQKLVMLGNAAMGDNEKMLDLVGAYGKIRARGKSTMRELNQFTQAGVPIIQALAPALNYIISLAIAAANAIAQLLAALGGKGVFVKATKQAKGLGAAVGGAGSAAKEAKKELASFDKLNVKKDDDAGGGGGGGGGAGAGGGFETAEIDSRIKGIADKIKDLIKAQDWEGLGAYLASGVNYGLEKLYDIINWDNVGPKITPFITAFTETFNSLVDHIDWDLMGRVIGTGINTLVNTLDLLITGIDWENLGKKFGEGANGMVKEIDWGKLGKMIGHKLSILPKMLAGFVMTMDWSALGTGIGLGIDTHTLEIRSQDFDLDAVLQGPELLQSFYPFQWSGQERCKFQ